MSREDNLRPVGLRHCHASISAANPDSRVDRIVDANPDHHRTSGEVNSEYLPTPRNS